MESHRTRKKIVICDECGEEFLTTRATKCLNCKIKESSRKYRLRKRTRK